MSKIGQKPVQVPGTVKVDIQQNMISIEGKNGIITIELPSSIIVKIDNGILNVERKTENKDTKAKHGLFRSLISNAVVGVEKAWEKRLEVVGTGFNVKMDGDNLFFKLGYSHPVIFNKVGGVKFMVEGNNKVIVAGADKQLVGQVAHQIKILRKPDVYKGKGVRYEGEKVRIKPGKKAKTA
ncbi:MAG: 50S ribosomal protein L6 [Candidatus Roizmanbacteria bacterium]